MRAKQSFKISAVVAAVVLCVCFAIVAYTRYTQALRLKQTSIAVGNFYAKGHLYQKLLESWTEIEPAKCGQPASTPGAVSFESITREHEGGISLATNEASYSKLSIGNLATKLNAKPEAVRSVVDTLRRLESPEIIQSSAEVKVISPENDTRGYLHIDQSCPNAATYAFWSRQPDNFNADNPGHYIGLKSLRNGWYYYAEQR
jgi:hypothetical protein